MPVEVLSCLLFNTDFNRLLDESGWPKDYIEEINYPLAKDQGACQVTDNVRVD